MEHVDNLHSSKLAVLLESTETNQTIQRLDNGTVEIRFDLKEGENILGLFLLYILIIHYYTFSEYYTRLGPDHQRTDESSVMSHKSTLFGQGFSTLLVFHKKRDMIPNIENYFIQIAFVLYDDILERNYLRTFDCPQFLWVLFYHSFERLKLERHNGLVKEFKVSNST